MCDAEKRGYVKRSKNNMLKFDVHVHAHVHLHAHVHAHAQTHTHTYTQAHIPTIWKGATIEEALQ